MVNLFNRLIVSVLLIVIAVILLVVAVTPQSVASFAASQLSQVHVDLISIDHLIIAVVCLVLFALCLILLRLQWSRGRPTSVPLEGGGSTELATESVVERLKQDVSTVADVRQVLPTIHVRGKVVDVALEVRTEAGVDVPTKASEVDQVVKDSIARLGLRLGRVRTKIVVARGAPTPGTS
jgi:cytoskeletal protein RodZ